MTREHHACGGKLEHSKDFLINTIPLSLFPVYIQEIIYPLFLSVPPPPYGPCLTFNLWFVKAHEIEITFPLL